MTKFILLLIFALAATAAPSLASSTDQLYQAWQSTNRSDHEAAAKAAKSYLHKTPKGEHAAELRAWLDAYHKALESLGLPSGHAESAGPTTASGASPEDDSHVREPKTSKRHKIVHVVAKEPPKETFLYDDLRATSRALTDSQRREAQNIFKVAGQLETTGDHVAAADAYNKALGMDPADVFGNYDYAQNLEKQNKPADALEYYFRAAALGGDEAEAFEAAAAIQRIASTNPPTISVDLIRQGNAYAAKNNWVAAVTAYSFVLKYFPNAYDALMGRAKANIGQKDFAAAMADLNVAATVYSNNSDVFFNRGLAYQLQNSFQEAAADYTRAIGFNPSNIPAILNRGWSNIGMKQYDFAINDGTEAVGKLQGGNAGNTPWFLRAYTLRATAHSDENQFSASAADYDQALLLSPTDPGMLNGACWARALANVDLDKALSECNTALGQLPNSPDIIDSRGFVYFRMNKFDLALADLNAAVKGNPKSGTILYHRGIAKLRMNDSAGGQADIARALALDPNASEELTGAGVTP